MLTTPLRLIGTLLLLPALAIAQGHSPKHFVFFGRDRARIHEAAFLENPGVAGAQLKYTWRELEPERDRYDFRAILDDLAWLDGHGKRLFIQLQDVSFADVEWIVPDYLLTDPTFHGGVVHKTDGGGFAARRWDPAVRERFTRLLGALGTAVDGRIEGLNFAETALGYDDTTQFHSSGFAYDIYAQAVRDIMTAARSAFPRSRVIVYANFMPGEWLPGDDHGYLRGVYAHAERIGVGVGGPDLRPNRPAQRHHSLTLIAARPAGIVAGLAVQDGNLADTDRATGQRVTVEGLVAYARDTLRLDYLFWGTEEPYYSAEILPYLERQGGRRK
jgi:hypothetical protein